MGFDAREIFFSLTGKRSECFRDILPDTLTLSSPRRYVFSVGYPSSKSHHTCFRGAYLAGKPERSPFSFDQPVFGAVTEGAPARSPSPCPSPIEGEGTQTMPSSTGTSRSSGGSLMRFACFFFRSEMPCGYVSSDKGGRFSFERAGRCLAPAPLVGEGRGEGDNWWRPRSVTGTRNPYVHRGRGDALSSMVREREAGRYGREGYCTLETRF